MCSTNCNLFSHLPHFLFDGIFLQSDYGLSQYDLGRILDWEATNAAWAAPETLEHSDLSKASEVYSFGIVLYEMLTGDMPFSSDYKSYWNFTNAIKRDVIKGIRPPYNEHDIRVHFHGVAIPSQIFQLMNQCWDEDPSKRPSFDEIYRIVNSLERPLEYGVSSGSSVLSPSLSRSVSTISSSSDIEVKENSEEFQDIQF